MPKKKFYAVAVGHTPGIYETWDECQQQVKGASKAIYKSFPTKEAAQNFMEANLNRNTKKRSATAPITEQLKKTNIRNQVPSKKFYAVAIGHEPGVYETWGECQKQVKGVSKALFKSFPSKGAAQKFVEANQKVSKKENLDDTNDQDKIVPTIKMFIHFDGGSRGNGRRFSVAGAGAVVEAHYPSIQTVMKIRKYLNEKDLKGASTTTNNFAEYSGVVVGMKEAKNSFEEFLKKNNAKNEVHKVSLEIKGDSLVVINQLKESFDCKSENLLSLYNEAKRLIQDMKKLGFLIKFEHVYRENNSDADALANEAMDARKSWITISNSVPKREIETTQDTQSSKENIKTIIDV